MPNHNEVYSTQASRYEEMIRRQPNLLAVVNEIRPFRNLDILDLGAGSGRLSAFLAPEAKSLVCTDTHVPMLEVLDEKLSHLKIPRNWLTVESDHRNLPFSDSRFDLVISGWSICYLASSNNDNWQINLEKVFSEIYRVLKPNGTIIIFETMGTGTETPYPPDFLKDYYIELENKYGFDHRWIRMDYEFDNVAEAVKYTEFFFEEELIRKINDNRWSVVPECAGIWWKQL